MREDLVTRTEREMERGRIIAERAKRQHDLQRYIEGKKVQIQLGSLKLDPPGPLHTWVQIFYVDGMEIARELEAADDYPSELLMAKIALAVNATVGFDGIPSAESIDPVVRRSRDEYRNRMGAQVPK